MPDMPDDTASDPERIDQLTDRIDRLESVVAAQQETIEELRDSSLLGQWGRRGVIGSAVAALGLASASGSAAAGVGQIGASSERVDVFGDQGDFNALEASELIIGDTLYKEDDNSPINVTGQTSVDYQVAGDFDQIIIIPDTSKEGFNNVRVNGNSDSSYRTITTGDSETTGLDAFDFPIWTGIGILFIRLENNGDVRFNIRDNKATTGVVDRGDYSGTTISSIDTLNFFSGSARDAKARVYGRSINI